MTTVRISEQLEVVVPKAARKATNLQPGKKIGVFPYNNRIELVPIEPMTKMHGFLLGTENTFDRETDRNV